MDVAVLDKVKAIRHRFPLLPFLVVRSLTASHPIPHTRVPLSRKTRAVCVFGEHAALHAADSSRVLTSAMLLRSLRSSVRC